MVLRSDWRRWRGFLAALLVFAFAAAPGLDAMICGCGEAAAAEAHGAGVPSCDDPPEDGAGHEGHGPCLHGHCHHGLSILASAGPAVTASATEGQLYLSPTMGPAISDRQFGLMRPPRA